MMMMDYYTRLLICRPVVNLLLIIHNIVGKIGTAKFFKEEEQKGLKSVRKLLIEKPQ